MLERYFVKPETVDRIRSSWIGGPIEQYVGWLSGQGYAPRNVFRRVPMLVRFGAFAQARGARRLEELPDHVEAFVAEQLRAHGATSDEQAGGKVASSVRSPIEQMLRVALPALPAVNHRPHLAMPFIAQAPGFFVYLREERGLREPTVDHYSHFLRRFETYLGRIGCLSLGALSAPVLSAFVTECSGSFGRSAMIGLCSSLRVFLRYLRRERVIAADLARHVELPQVYRLAELPRSIGWDDVRRMLEAVDRANPCRPARLRHPAVARHLWSAGPRGRPPDARRYRLEA